MSRGQHIPGSSQERQDLEGRSIELEDLSQETASCVMCDQIVPWQHAYPYLVGRGYPYPCLNEERAKAPVLVPARIDPQPWLEINGGEGV